MTLLADKGKREQGGAVQAAAQHRTLDPEMWATVVDGVGGLDEPLEQIRRRIYVPLCAPMTLLDELGAERVKGLLLYGCVCVCGGGGVR